MTSFDLNPAYLAAAATCVSSEETRYYLKGVFVTPRDMPDFLRSGFARAPEQAAAE